MTPVYCQLGKDAGGVLLLQFNAGGALAVATAGRALPGRTSQHSFNILIIILLQTGAGPIKILQRKFYATQFFKHSDWIL